MRDRSEGQMTLTHLFFRSHNGFLGMIITSQINGIGPKKGEKNRMSNVFDKDKFRESHS